MIYNIPRNTQEYPENPKNTRKYWIVKKIPKKYLVVYFNTPTRPELDPLSGIFSNTGPDQLLKNPTSWGLLVVMNKTYTTLSVLIILYLCSEIHNTTRFYAL